MHSPEAIAAAEDSAAKRQAEYRATVKARSAKRIAEQNRERLANASEALENAHAAIEAAADALDVALDDAFQGVDVAADGRLEHLPENNPLRALAAEIEDLRPDHAIAERVAGLSTDLSNYVEHLEGLAEE